MGGHAQHIKYRGCGGANADGCSGLELCVDCLQAPLEKLGLVFVSGKTKTFSIAANVGEGLTPSQGTSLKTKSS